jgi:hypothetical protein
MRTLLHLKRLPWIAALVAAGTLPSLAQQPDDLQKQLEQLKQQYDATTRDLQQRIAALELEIQKEKEEKEKQKEASEKAKEGTVSAVELAAQQAAEKAVLGQSNDVGAKYQGQVSQEPEYDYLREADQKIAD